MVFSLNFNGLFRRRRHQLSECGLQTMLKKNKITRIYKAFRDDFHEQELCIAQDVVDFLRANVRERGIFRLTGQFKPRQKILGMLLRGDRELLQSQLRRETAIEVAAAFQMFVQCFKQPLIPNRVQELLLADNPGVPEAIIAEDALGLLHQELSGRHLHLLRTLFELLSIINQMTERTELSSLSLPISLLHTFFNITQPWSSRWQRLAMTLNEIITRAPDWPESNASSSSSLNSLCQSQSFLPSAYE